MAKVAGNLTLRDSWLPKLVLRRGGGGGEVETLEQLRMG